MKNSMNAEDKLILLIDEDDFLSQYLKTILNTKGYKVVVTNSVKQAVEVFKADPSRINLIIMDITKDLESGVKFCKKLRSIDPEILILLTSVYSQEFFKDIEHLYFVRKPMAPSELFIILNKIFENSKFNHKFK